MSLPPWSDVWDVLYRLMAPGLAASLLVMLAVRLLGRERLTPLAAALALVVGVFGSYCFREEGINWRFDNERPLTANELLTVLGWSLEGKPPAAPQETDEAGEPLPTPESEDVPEVPQAVSRSMLIL